MGQLQGLIHIVSQIATHLNALNFNSVFIPLRLQEIIVDRVLDERGWSHSTFPYIVLFQCQIIRRGLGHSTLPYFFFYFSVKIHWKRLKPYALSRSALSYRLCVRLAAERGWTQFHVIVQCFNFQHSSVAIQLLLLPFAAIASCAAYLCA